VTRAAAILALLLCGCQPFVQQREFERAIDSTRATLNDKDEKLDKRLDDLEGFRGQFDAQLTVIKGMCGLAGFAITTALVVLGLRRNGTKGT